MPSIAAGGAFGAAETTAAISTATTASAAIVLPMIVSRRLRASWARCRLNSRLSPLGHVPIEPLGADPRRELPTPRNACNVPALRVASDLIQRDGVLHSERRE